LSPRSLACGELIEDGAEVLQVGFGTDEKVSGELKKNIMQARLDKKLTQAQLAQVRLAVPGSDRNA
jgi:hypothetical protein